MRASIINSIKFQLCAALGSDTAGITVWTKNVARFGFKQVLKFIEFIIEPRINYLF